MEMDISVKGRARKPNFTNEEIDLLLDLVSGNREALLSNNNKAHGVRTKQVIWQQIAADVTLNSTLCQRDAIDVRQKWKDLLVSIVASGTVIQMAMSFIQNHTLGITVKPHYNEIAGGREISSLFPKFVIRVLKTIRYIGMVGKENYFFITGLSLNIRFCYKEVFL